MKFNPINVFKKSLNGKVICILCTLSTIVIGILLMNVAALQIINQYDVHIHQTIEYYETLLSQNNVIITMEEQAMIDSLFNKASAKISGTLTFNYFLLGFWVITIVGAVIFVKKIFIKPITNITYTLNEIIEEIENGQGDLTRRIETRNIDETGQLANGINNFIENLQKILNKIKDNSNQLTESSAFIKDRVSEVNDNIQNVVAVTEELSASIEETTATIETISSGSEHILKEVNSVNELTTKESRKMLEIKENADSLEMETLKKKTDSAELISTLTQATNIAIEESKGVEEINKLTAEILNIASQTNLLSLNASIEASHAGDAGKGFAIVAKEIQKLSEESRETAANIQKMNKLVTNAVKKLVDNSTELLNVINTSVSEDYDKFVFVAQQYKNDADYISSVLNNISGQAENIQTTMNDMNEGLKSITIAMNDSSIGIGSVAEENTNLASAVSAVQDKIIVNNEISEGLKQEVDFFKKI